MKKVNFLGVAAALLLGSLYGFAAESSAAAHTNTAAAKFYFVSGDGVLAPGRFVYHEGVTVTEAIRMAGGFSKMARKSRVEVIRNGQNHTFVVNVSKIETGQATNVAIKPEDCIYVRGPTVIRKSWSDVRGFR